MSNVIGTFKATADGYTGTVRTLVFNAPVTIKAVPKTKETAPDYHLYAGEVHIGAAWKATAEGSGVQYVRLTIDDASLVEPLSACLFISRDNPGEAELVWSRPRLARAAGGRR